MSGKKISELHELLELGGDEYLVIAYEGLNFKVKVNTLNFLLNNIDLADLGLDEVDNTSDLEKPISDATRDALRGKASVTHQHEITDVEGLAELLNFLEQKIEENQQNEISVSYRKGTW